MVLVIALPSVGAAARRGVPRGTPVTVRTNPQNNIVTAVRTAAARVHLGPINAVGFERNCSPVVGAVIVCRDSSLMATAERAEADVGRGWCVVRLDPRVGGGQPAIRKVTQLLRKCRR
jgi:hypothetical protein